jgi:nitrogen regulatory protein P-II 2
MTVSEVNGFGRQKGHTEIYRGAEYEVSMLPKLKLDMAVSDSIAAQGVVAVAAAAKTDNSGDGKFFVLSLEAAMRIRTGETGEGAL